MVSWLVCWTGNQEIRVQIPTRAEIWLEISAPPAPPSQLSYDISTLTTHCHEYEMVIERTGHPPSYAEVKKKSR